MEAEEAADWGAADWEEEERAAAAATEEVDTGAAEEKAAEEEEERRTSVTPRSTSVLRIVTSLLSDCPRCINTRLSLARRH